MVKLSLADLNEYMTTFQWDRITVRRENRDEATVLADLHRIDDKCVAWFAAHGIELIVDRDTVNFKRLVIGST